jgi:nuclear GTP-binding protein
VLRDWSLGNFPRCTVPLNESTTSIDAVEDLRAGELHVLTTLPTRKELWKRRGLVKLVPGDLETRIAILDEQWHSLVDEKENWEARHATECSLEVNDDGGCGTPSGVSDGNGSDEADRGEGPRQPPPIPSRVKRKHKAENTTFSSNKKVASPSEGRGSNRSRTAGSLNRMVSDKPAIQTCNLVSEQEGIVANVLTAKQAQGVTDEAYDFSQFFH